MKITVILISSLALSACDDRPVAHHIILGKWKSNAELTLQSMNSAEGVTPKAKTIFEDDFFGHLEVEWKEKESRAINVRDDYDSGYEPYEVVEITEEYIKVKEWSDILQQHDEYTLHFEGNCYYIITSKFEFREYFCKQG